MSPLLEPDEDPLLLPELLDVLAPLLPDAPLLEPPFDPPPFEPLAPLLPPFDPLLEPEPPAPPSSPFPPLLAPLSSPLSKMLLCCGVELQP